MTTYKQNQAYWKKIYNSSEKYVAKMISFSQSGIPDIANDSDKIRDIAEFIVNQVLIELVSYGIDTTSEFPIVDRTDYPKGM